MATKFCCTEVTPPKTILRKLSWQEELKLAPDPLVSSKKDVHLIILNWFRITMEQTTFSSLLDVIQITMLYLGINGAYDTKTVKGFYPLQISSSMTENVPFLCTESKTATITYPTILILGEADFSFSVAFIYKRRQHNIHFPGDCIVASELRTEKNLRSIYSRFCFNISALKEYGVTVLFGVDATNLHRHFKNKNFNKIYFNCPHGANMNPYSGDIGNKIIKPFFKSASKHQDIGDKIYVTIPYPTHRNRNIKMFIKKERKRNFFKGMDSNCMKQVCNPNINISRNVFLIHKDIRDMHIDKQKRMQRLKLHQN